jgi:hypothetical protein
VCLVRSRHLTLIADYMTFMGGFRPLSRTGIDANAAPFQKITFETSINFIKVHSSSGSTTHTPHCTTLHDTARHSKKHFYLHPPCFTRGGLLN